MLSSVFLIVCSVGLFLFAIRIIDETVGKYTIPPSISDRLKKPFPALFFGLFFASVCQSSSAVNSLVAGLRNTEKIEEKAAFYIVSGSNIGTTIAAYFAGFDNKFIIIMLASSVFFSSVVFAFSHKEKTKTLTKFISGFSLIFVSFYLIGATLPNFINIFKIDFLAQSNPFIPFFFGMLLTILCQSSSIVSIMIITFAQFNAVTPVNALFLIMAANIGTCSTVFLTSIGKSAKSYRVALFNLLFNIFAALFFIVMYYLHFLDWYLEINVALDTKIAIFHTVFNVAGCALTYFFIPWFSKFKPQKKRRKNFASPRILQK